MRRCGVSEFVSIVFYVAIVVAAIGIVLNVALPRINTMEESASVENNINAMQELDSAIRQVASEGRYSTRRIGLTFKHGEYRFDNTTGTFYYQVETDSGMISPHTTITMGGVDVSASAAVTIRNDTVGGVDCYRMENDVLSACIRKLPDRFDGEFNPETVGYWRISDPGDVVADVSMYDHTGAVAGDPQPVDGVHDTGLAFDGDGDYVDIGDTAPLRIAGNRTVSAWIQVPPEGDCRVIAGKTGEYQLYIGCGGVQDQIVFQVHDDTGGYTRVVGPNVSDGDWHHVVGRYESGEVGVWVDGAQEGAASMTESPTTDSAPFRIGARDDGTMPYNGTIDEVRLYNQSLHTARIQELYEKRGHLYQVDTEDMVLELRDRETGTVFNGSIDLFVDRDPLTATGGGHTVVEEMGARLGRGRVQLTVTSTPGEPYTVDYLLLSGADFLALQSDTTPTTVRAIVDENRPVYIDGQQRSPGAYTDGEIEHGYAVGADSGRVAGIVTDLFESVGYQDTGGGYRVNATATEEAVFLLPFTQGDWPDIDERMPLITGGAYGPDQFFSYPEPTFGGEISEEKTVTAALSYDSIVLDGPDHPVSQGTYQVIVRNDGVVGGKPQVSIDIK